MELSAVDSRDDLFTGVEAAQGEALALWVKDRVLRACGIGIIPHLQRAVDGGGAGRGGQGQDAGEGGELHLETSAAVGAVCWRAEYVVCGWLSGLRAGGFSDETSAFPFYTIPESSSTVKTSSILWDWTGLQQGSRLAALAVSSPQSLNDGTAGPLRSYFHRSGYNGPTWHDALVKVILFKDQLILEGARIRGDHRVAFC